MTFDDGFQINSLDESSCRGFQRYRFYLQKARPFEMATSDHELEKKKKNETGKRTPDVIDPVELF
jgi:hypothetical protein